MSTRPDDVAANVREILGLVRDGSAPTQKPEAVIDPTANVLSLVAAADRRQDDLRNNDKTWRDRLDSQTQKWRDKLDAERQRADANASKAEAGRLDALLLANTNNVALALAKQEAVTQEQARRLAVLEQNQYQQGGATIQRTEARGQGNFNISQAITIGGILVLVLVDLKTKGVI